MNENIKHSVANYRTLVFSLFVELQISIQLITEVFLSPHSASPLRCAHSAMQLRICSHVWYAPHIL